MKCIPSLLFALLATGSMNAQSLSPQVVASSGESSQVGAVSLSWTLGEPAVSSLTAPDLSLTQGFHQGEPLRLHIHIRAFLEGAYGNGSGLMSDLLRTGTLNGVTYPLIPVLQPYGAAPFTYAGSEAVSPSVLGVSGSNAITDWVLVELRDAAAASTIVASRAALIQRDGDIVDVDGFSPVTFSELSHGTFHVAVRHRNHMGVMTANALALGPVPITLDLSDPSTATYGSDARKEVAGVSLLWMGNSRADDRVKYTGAGNDRDPILVRIGGSVPTNTVKGYHPEDNTMDGQVKYTGLNNDRDPILVNLPGSVISFRNQQLP